MSSITRLIDYLFLSCYCLFATNAILESPISWATYRQISKVCRLINSITPKITTSSWRATKRVRFSSSIRTTCFCCNRLFTPMFFECQCSPRDKFKRRLIDSWPDTAVTHGFKLKPRWCTEVAIHGPKRLCAFTRVWGNPALHLHTDWSTDNYDLAKTIH